MGVGGVGCYDGQVFCGSSFVLAPWGELAAQAPSLEEALLVCDVDPSAEGPLAEPLAPEVYDAPLMTWGALTAGLAEECPGEEGACVLVDDRIGSLLVATLATDALGPLRVRALLRRTGDAARDAVAESLVRALRIPEERVGRLEPVDGADEELSLDLAQARPRRARPAHGRGATRVRRQDRPRARRERPLERGAPPAARRPLPL